MSDALTPPASTDPTGDDETRSPAEAVLVQLRTSSRHRHLVGGFGPLVLAALLFLAMVLLAPSIAPERVVERPVEPAEQGAEGGG